MHTHEPAEKNLAWSIGLTACIFVLELAGGWYTGSLALLADAGHVFMDVFALALSLVALKLSAIPADSRRTFGWHRVEVFAAFLNGVVLVVLSIGILREAYERIQAPQTVLPLPMMVVAVLGLAVNVWVVRKLAGHHQHDLNIRSAYLHVVGDMLSSILVVIGGVVMYFTGFWQLDALLSMGIALLILAGAFNVLRESVHILLEGAPRHINVRELETDIQAREGVDEVHDVHLWSVCSHIVTLACHVHIAETHLERRDTIVAGLHTWLREKYQISHSIIEVERGDCGHGLIAQDLKHGHVCSGYEEGTEAPRVEHGGRLRH